jgi:hypothetical protein
MKEDFELGHVNARAIYGTFNEKRKNRKAKMTSKTTIS